MQLYKSNVIIVESKEDRKLCFANVQLSGGVLNICSQAKHLGHFIYITDWYPRRALTIDETMG